MAKKKKNIKKVDFAKIKMEVIPKCDNTIFISMKKFSHKFIKLHTIKPFDMWYSPIIPYQESVHFTLQKNKSGKAFKQVMTKTIKAKTQKAKGVMYGLKHLYKGKEFYSLRSLTLNPKHTLITDVEQIEKNSKLPCFARPCPEKPRHGFVDSRVIKTNKELLALWKEVKAQDKNGEIILGPYFANVKYNSVYMSSGGLSIGAGNDGATAGNNSISFPVAPIKFSSVFLKASGLKQKQTVYLEAVYVNDTYNVPWKLVQARGGPTISAVSPNYIPKSVTVKNIVIPHNDLLKWEKEAKQFKTGTVVYGAGHTLASHAAIHCVLNKIPFVTTFKPNVGDVLVPQGEKDVKINRIRFKKGVRAGLHLSRTSSYEDMKIFFYYSISVLHNWAYIKHSEHADWLLGAAAILFAKVGKSLCYGEYRHIGKGKNISRENMYQKMMKGSIISFHKLPKVFKNFHSGNWSSGFGGIPWATCTWYTYMLWKNIVTSFNRKSSVLSDKEISDIVTVMNKTTNIAHNNGWWFNKIAQKADLDSIALNPGCAALCVSDLYFKLHKKVQSIKNVKRNFHKANVIVRAPCATDNHGRLSWLYVYGIGKKTEFTLWSEDGKSKRKYIKLTPSEVTGLLRRKRKMKGKNDQYSKLLVPIKSKSKFQIPGGKVRDLGKVFKVA